MKISFVIITNGSKLDKIQNQIYSIEENFASKKNDEDYEIIISGNVSKIKDSLFFKDRSKIIFVDNEDAAQTGNLSKMRNDACACSNMDYLVISDDDILFSNNWLSVLKETEDFDILVPRVFCPDGTRFWDYSCYLSPTKGHIILNPEEEDDYIYMSGGTGWVMKREVWNEFKWDESYTIYSSVKGLQDYRNGNHNEDTEYSMRCRSKYKIKHNPNLHNFHDDPKYTSIGRIVRKRNFQDSQSWTRTLSKFPTKVLIELSDILLKYGIEAEAVDVLRIISEKDFAANLKLESIQKAFGGELEGSNFKTNE